MISSLRIHLTDAAEFNQNSARTNLQTAAARDTLP
jgi:hypothetical protein